MSERLDERIEGVKKVPFRHWVWLVGLAVGVAVLSSVYADKSQGMVGPPITYTVGDIGYITEDTHLCHTDVIAKQTISGLAQWSALIDRLRAAGGALFLSEEDNDLGSNLARYCSTLAEGYPVILYEVAYPYALASFDPSLGFGDGTFIIRLFDFQTGGLRL